MSGQYKITSEPLENYRPTAANLPAGLVRDNARPARRVRTGLIPAAHMSIVLIWLIRVIALLLIILSLFGTFYGMSGQAMPLSRVGQLWTDISLAKEGFAIAVGLQIVFSVIQWGSMGHAKTDPRWWGLYLIALGFSGYWNWQAYHQAMIDTMHMPWLLALIVIIASDVLAEKALIL